MSTRDSSQIDGPGAELQLIVVPFEKMRQRAAGLVARTDPVLFKMYGLVETLVDRRQYRDAATAMIAFYGRNAACVARRMQMIAQNPRDIRLVQGLIDDISQHK
ncbi:hypothetical protein [Mesorhizobium sp. 8]|uniref:hypothetical protein n=1 Tax=Mesorhizobium sp. 8 TaxID=2584466 RepID=UPI0011222E55|nr:hypothetical protein [Mesorhizobium sp. 8]QDC00360.1 hypothetical protein FGU64_07990 [Mesorhizobium sp. 8]